MPGKASAGWHLRILNLVEVVAGRGKLVCGMGLSVGILACAGEFLGVLQGWLQSKQSTSL